MRIAILDLNNGYPNQGLRCIHQIADNFNLMYGGEAIIFEVRRKHQFPDINQFDAFISSGGPGNPLPEGHPWEKPYFQFLDSILMHNRNSDRKKYLFLICHSFQLACGHWRLGLVNERNSYSFGIMPVHKTVLGKQEKLFENLPDPFFAVDSRGYQVVKPRHAQLKKMGGSVLAIEKFRPHVKLERSIMAIRFTPEIFGTQFHPEADAEGMLEHFGKSSQKEKVITVYGEEKYEGILEDLQDPNKIALTEREILPRFLTMANADLHCTVH